MNLTTHVILKKYNETIFFNSLLVLATLSMLTACQTESPTSKNEKAEQSDNKNESNKDSVYQKMEVKDSTNYPIPEEFKEIDDMMPEPPLVGYDVKPEPVFEEIIPEQDTIYDFVDKMPEYPGGEIKLKAFLKNEIRYPAFAKEENIEGTVYVRFVVNENGDVIDPVILKTPNKVFDEPSLSVIRRMPKWTPGEDRGKKVKVNIAIPIRYSLRK